MSEFGNESATAVIKLSEEAMKQLFELLKWLLHTKERMTNRKLKKIETQLRKNELQGLQKKEALKEARALINKKSGYIKLKKMLNTEEKLIPTGVALSPKELNRFQHYAELVGLSYTLINDKKNLEQLRDLKSDYKDLVKISKKDGLTEEQVQKKEFIESKINDLESQRDNKIVLIREKDLALMKDVTDRINYDIRFDDYEKALNDIDNNKDLSQDEKDKLKSEINVEKAKLYKQQFENYNQQSADEILEQADGNNKEEVDFERAVCLAADRNNVDNPIYIVDATDPEKYIETSSEIQERVNNEGEITEYVSTQYKAITHGEVLKSEEFSHGKFIRNTDFSGENTSKSGIEHWEHMKKELQEKGGFSDSVYVFSEKKEFDKFRENMKENISNEKDIEASTSLDNLDKEELIDFNAINTALTDKLHENGFVVNDKFELCDKSTGELVSSKDYEDKYKVISSKNIAKRLENYNDMSKLQRSIYIRKDELADVIEQIASADGEAELTQLNKQKEVLTNDLKSLNERFDTKLSISKQLQNKQNEILSTKVLQDVENEQVFSNTLEDKELNSKSFDEWHKQVKERQSARNIGDKTNTIENIKTDVKMPVRE